MIFGCRAGCNFSDIARELSYRGLVKNESLSPQVIHEFKKESPVVYRMYLWAMTIIDIVAEEGCYETEDRDLLMEAIRYKYRADRTGITHMDRETVWNFAALRERGLINGHI